MKKLYVKLLFLRQIQMLYFRNTKASYYQNKSNFNIVDCVLNLKDLKGG